MDNKSREAESLLGNPVFKEGVQNFLNKYEERCYVCDLDQETLTQVILAKRIAREFIATFQTFIDDQMIKDYNDSRKREGKKPEFKR